MIHFRETYYQEDRTQQQKEFDLPNYDDAYLHASKIFYQSAEAVSITKTQFKNGKVEISICSRKRLLLKIQSL
jgi:hypothetical protein